MSTAFCRSWIRLVLGAVVGGILCVSVAQGQQQDVAAGPAKKAEPSTAVEKFVARRGRLIVKDFYKVGVVEGKYLGSLDIQLLVFSAPGAASQDKVFGVRFERPAVKDYESDETGFLDFDESSALLEALAFMETLAGRMSSEEHENTEVIYETRGGMRLGFVQSGREQTAFVGVGGPIGGKHVFLTMGALNEVNKLLKQAVARLGKMGAK